MKTLLRITLSFFFYVQVFLVFAQDHQVLIQAQGKDISSSISRKWTEGMICTKQDGIQILDEVWNSLSTAQKKEREDAYKMAQNYIKNAPVNGIVGGSSWSKSFQDSDRSHNTNRIDINIFRGAAFSNDRQIVYIKMMGSDLSSTKEWKYDNKHIVNKDDALKELKGLFNSLSTEQRNKRDDAFRKAESWIKSAPDNGYIGSNLVTDFKNSDASAGELIRITIDKGAAFSK